jgi:hypothetical protein
MTEPAHDDRQIERLWTYADLMVRYGVGERQIRRVVKTLGLRPVPLGNRTVRFRPVAVMAAEERAERGSVGGGRSAVGGEAEFVMPDRRRNRR